MTHFTRKTLLVVSLSIIAAFVVLVAVFTRSHGSLETADDVIRYLEHRANICASGTTQVRYQKTIPKSENSKVWIVGCRSGEEQKFFSVPDDGAGITPVVQLDTASQAVDYVEKKIGVCDAGTTTVNEAEDGNWGNWIVRCEYGGDASLFFIERDGTYAN
jgi:hypothetical protein